MDANIHISEQELSLAILEILNSSTIEIVLYGDNFGEIIITDSYGNKLTKSIHLNDYRIENK